MTDPGESLKPLRPIDGPVGDPTVHHISSALRPTEESLRGDVSFSCPHCRTVLVEGSTEDGVKRIKSLQCYVCGRWCAGA